MSSRNPRRGSPRPLRTLAVLAFAALVLGLAFVVRSLGQLPDPTIDAARLADAPYGAPVWSGRLENPALIEASGFARSHRDPARLWAINDSGHAAVLYALGFDGAHQGTLTLHPITSREYPTPAQRPKNSRLDSTALFAAKGIRLRPWQDALPIVVSAIRSQDE